MSNTLTTTQENGTEKKTRNRTIALDSLISQIEKQTLESKIKIQSAIKASIENDKKKLQEQLALINESEWKSIPEV